MRIVGLDVYIVEAGYLSSSLFQTRIASPMSRYPEFAERRGSWMWPPQKVVAVCRGEGSSEGVAVTSGGPVVATILRDQLGRLVSGRDAQDVEGLWELLFRALAPFDRSGFALMAVAAVDIAVWDLLAKEAGRPLLELLGGTPRPSVPAYVTTTRPARFAGGGFLGIKVPMPYGPEGGEAGKQVNVEAVRQARLAAGDDADVMVDAFMAWNAAYTVEMARLLEPYRVRWIEDPLLPDDIDGFREIVRRAGSAAPLALGNFCYHRWDCQRLLEAGVVSYLQPDVAWAGGITECRRIAALAAERGVPVVYHNTAEQPWAVSLSAAVANCPFVEVVDRGDDSLLQGLLENMPRVDGGRVLIDKSPAGNVFSDLLRERAKRF